MADTARNVIWKCLVDDPALFLRHFLEKLTNKDRQVNNKLLMFIKYSIIISILPLSEFVLIYSQTILTHKNINHILFTKF